MLEEVCTKIYDHCYVWRRKPKDAVPVGKHRGGSIMLWGCLAAGGTGALHKGDGITRKENYVDILKQYLKKSARKLKAWSQMGLSTSVTSVLSRVMGPSSSNLL